MKNRPNRAAPFLQGFFMDLPALRDDELNVPGLHVGATCEDPSKPWRNYGLFESSNPDSGFQKRAEYQSRLRVGMAQSLPLGTASVDYRLVDYASSFVVEMLHPEDALEAVTDQEMVAGRNRFLVGDEIMGVATPRLLSTDPYTGLDTYEFTTLLRGLQDTFPEMDTHVSGEPVVWLDGPGLNFFVHSASRINEARYYKVVPAGGTIAEAVPQLVTSSGRTLKPFRPLQIAGTRDGSNNLTVTWERQTRRTFQIGEQSLPLEEELERYRIQVLSGAGAVIRDTIVRVDPGAARTWLYTAFAQSGDGITPGSPVTLELSQLSALVNDGNASRVTL